MDNRREFAAKGAGEGEGEEELGGEGCLAGTLSSAPAHSWQCLLPALELAAGVGSQPSWSTADNIGYDVWIVGYLRRPSCLQLGNVYYYCKCSVSLTFVLLNV